MARCGEGIAPKSGARFSDKAMLRKPRPEKFMRFSAEAVR
jgi:hypothetical protein